MDRTVLTDEQWATIWAFLAAHPRVYVGRPEACRRFLNAVLWVLRSGAQWRFLPAQFGRWNSVFKRFARWSERGVWADLHRHVIVDPDWQEVFLDSTIVRAHACAAGQPESTAEAEALGRSRGGFSTKVHAITDALGNPLDFVLTAGQAADITQAEALLPDAPIEAVVADKGYDADAFVAQVTGRGAKAVIPPRKNRKQPREYDRHIYKERHLIECFFGKIKHYRRIFSRFEKTARNYLSFLRFVAALVWLR
jgi:transposase